MNRNETGKFESSKNYKIAVGLDHLPKTNREVVEFYQTQNILQRVENGIELKLLEGHSKGNKYNDGLVFYSPSTSSYKSVMPRLDYQSNLSLVTTNSIIYNLLLKDSHRSVAQKNQWKFIYEDGSCRYRTSSITQIRSNSLIYLFFSK